MLQAKSHPKAKISIEYYPIKAGKLIDKIHEFIASFERQLAKSAIDKTVLQIQYDFIQHYLNHPDKVPNACFQGGVRAIQQRYAPQLMRISLYLLRDNLISLDEAKVVVNGMSLLAREVKFRTAYNKLLTGRKFKKAGFGIYDKEHPVTQPNPIKVRSKKNIAALEALLLRLEGSPENPHNLRDDELELFEELQALPFRVQHATNHYYRMLNAGSVDSIDELQRRNPEAKPEFSTKGNLDKLGNGGFVFFRMFVESVNSAKTRYGDTTLTFNWRLVQQHGWVSLHDQLVPFHTKSRNSRCLYRGKRLLRMADTCHLDEHGKESKADKVMHNTLRYRYRTTKIENYDAGSVDAQKAFGKTIKAKVVRRKFLGEIFYGPDIAVGIALSVIRELRYLEACGFRERFLQQFMAFGPEQRIDLLGNLIKDLFRLEAKYPVALRFASNPAQKQQSYSLFSGANQASQSFTVDNPEGDSRIAMDLSVNNDAMAAAKLEKEYKDIIEKLSNIRRHRARVDKVKAAEHYHLLGERIEQLLQQKAVIEAEIEQNQQLRVKALSFLQTYCESPEELEKIATSKLVYLYDNFEDLIEREEVELSELLKFSYAQLVILVEYDVVELVITGELTLEKLHSFEAQGANVFEILKEYNTEVAIRERGYTLEELITLYQKNPRHLEILCCDDITDMLLQEGADADELLIEYAREFDVDFAWVAEELPESEAMNFLALIGAYEDIEPPDEEVDFSGWVEEDSDEEDSLSSPVRPRSSGP